jgi:hypothetical protein
MPDLSPTIIDPVLTERLGQIVVRFSSIEYWITLLLATLLQADHGGMMLVTTNVSVAQQTKWIRGILALRSQEWEESERVLALLARAEEIRTERNELAHGIWENGPEPQTALVQTVGLDRPEIIRSRLVTLHDLDQLVIEINHWIEDYVTLGRELGFPRRAGMTESIFAD